MAATDKYVLRVTAGSSYDVDTHEVVPVNSAEPLKVSNDFMDVELNVRVQNYRGLPRNSPTTSAYFSQPPHDYNKDQYSISFRFTPKKPAASSAAETSSEEDDDDDDDDDAAKQPSNGISAADLQWGNDFDHPIRDRLPPGFNTAMGIVKWWIDPGLDGDAYADEPYLYGHALSSFNSVHVGKGENDPEKGGLWFDEGGDEEGMEARRAIGAPDDAKKRMKWGLRADSKEKWLFEHGKTYGVDFYNPYLDFGDFSLKLPGFTLPIMKYWDGQGLRYVLRNKSTGDTYLVVLFTLYLKEDVNEDGSLKPEALASNTSQAPGATTEPSKAKDEPEDQAALEEARKKLEGLDTGKSTKADDNNDDEGD
ncbi:f-box domain containing protein [Apiospora saccharicola]|uniref:F-box domain containing protein n=1 Tax=Apiospora saccharicola TaxID=335842 RepID=A0ABR1VNA3_9PEZI